MISIIIPVKDEELNVIPLAKSIKESLQYKHELLFIDDGSIDTTYKKLNLIKGIKIIKLRKNFGKSTALMHGIKLAKGEYVLMMDGDGEDKPEEINKLYNTLISSNYDCIVGWRKHRKHSFSKKLFSKFFNYLSSSLTKLKIHDANCGFKIMTKKAANSLELRGELHRYIPIILHSKGFKIGEHIVKHEKRKYGKTKYGVFRLFSGFIDLLTVLFLTRYSKKPSHFFSMVGFLFLILSIFTESITLYRKFILTEYIEIVGTTTALFFITSIFFIFFGLLSELIISNKNNIEYQIKEVVEQ